MIPTIMWGKPDTFKFCFDGYPFGGIVAVSTEGAFMSKQRMDSFMNGYRTMVDRLGPSGIILHGKEPEKLHANVVARIETFTQQIKAREKKAKNGGQTDGIA